MADMRRFWQIVTEAEKKLGMGFCLTNTKDTNPEDEHLMERWDSWTDFDANVFDVTPNDISCYEDIRNAVVEEYGEAAVAEWEAEMIAENDEEED